VCVCQPPSKFFFFSTHASTVDEFSSAAPSKPTYFSMVTEKRRNGVRVCACVTVRVSERESKTQSLVSIVIEFQHLNAVQLNGSQNGGERERERERERGERERGGMGAGFLGMSRTELKMLSGFSLRRHIQ
jgi:hypothetical protein